MRGHKQSSSRQLNRHWQSGRKKDPWAGWTDNGTLAVPPVTAGAWAAIAWDNNSDPIQYNIAGARSGEAPVLTFELHEKDLEKLISNPTLRFGVDIKGSLPYTIKEGENPGYTMLFTGLYVPSDVEIVITTTYAKEDRTNLWDIADIDTVKIQSSKAAAPIWTVDGYGSCPYCTMSSQYKWSVDIYDTDTLEKLYKQYKRYIDYIEVDVKYGAVYIPMNNVVSSTQYDITGYKYSTGGDAEERSGKVFAEYALTTPPGSQYGVSRELDTYYKIG